MNLHATGLWEENRLDRELTQTLAGHANYIKVPVFNKNEI